jgi:hypothetical protein
MSAWNGAAVPPRHAIVTPGSDETARSAGSVERSGIERGPRHGVGAPDFFPTSRLDMFLASYGRRRPGRHWRNLQKGSVNEQGINDFLIMMQEFLKAS